MFFYPCTYTFLCICNIPYEFIKVPDHLYVYISVGMNIHIHMYVISNTHEQSKSAYIYINQTHQCKNAAHMNTLHNLTTWLPYHPHNVPYQACLQHQGAHATELMPPLVQLWPLVQYTVANCRTAQVEAKSDVSTSQSDVSTSQRKADRRATEEGR